MKLPVLIAAAIFALPVSAQPTSGPSAPDAPADAASSALDASLEAVVHHGEAVLLWDALPGTTEYVVEVSRPGAPLTVATRIPASPATDAVGYAVRLDLADGAWSVRVSTHAASTAVRALTVEQPDIVEPAPVVELFAQGG